MSIYKLSPDDVKPYLPATLDIETRQDGSLIAIGFAYYTDRRIYKTFTSWNSWLAHLKPIIKGEYRYNVNQIFAHNGGGFDWLSLFEALDSETTIRVFMSNSKMIGASLKIPGFRLKLKLMDSLSLLPGSLSKLTYLFSIEHKKLDLGDNRLPEEIYEVDTPLFWKYLKHDVLGLQETVYEFWNYIYQTEGSIGTLPMTLASLSLKLWRKGLESDIQTTWNQELRIFERRSYTGGRVELFEPGIHEKILAHDINSLYPSVMINNKYPLSYKGGWVYEYNGFGIYEVQYCQTNRAIPPLLRNEQTGEFSYSGSGVFTSIELEYLSKIGGFFKVIKGYVYHETGDLFTDYITRWYDRRLEQKKTGNEGLSYVCKILMNSLYGKFGQREESWGLYSFTPDLADSWLEDEVEFIEYGNFASVKEDTHSEHIFVAIASFVTSYARCKLFDYIMEVVYSGSHLIYVDTDSVHHTGTHIPESKELGGMKLEFQGSGIYLARKLHYHLESNSIEKITAKGIGKTGRDKLTRKDFQKMVLGEQVPVSFLAFRTVREVLLNGEKACKPFDRTRTLKITEKESEFIYNERLIQYNKEKWLSRNLNNGQ